MIAALGAAELLDADHGDLIVARPGEIALGDGADELLEVFDPPGRVRRLVLLPHVHVAGLVEHDGERGDVALALDPLGSGRVMLGNDGGFFSSVSGGAWQKCVNLPITQFYSGSVAPANAAREARSISGAWCASSSR